MQSNDINKGQIANLLTGVPGQSWFNNQVRLKPAYDIHSQTQFAGITLPYLTRYLLPTELPQRYSVAYAQQPKICPAAVEAESVLVLNLSGHTTQPVAT